MKTFLITAPDWSLLRIQKNSLVNVAMDKYTSDCEITRAEASDIDGVVNFLDYIQEVAVESGVWSEEEVFGISTEKLTLDVEDSTCDISKELYNFIKAVAIMDYTDVQMIVAKADALLKKETWKQ